MIVLDASALLAFLFRESGHESVASELEHACISAVSLSEVIGRFARDGHDAREVLERIEKSPVEIVPFLGEDAALAAALVPAATRIVARRPRLAGVGGGAQGAGMDGRSSLAFARSCGEGRGHSLRGGENAPGG